MPAGIEVSSRAIFAKLWLNFSVISLIAIRMAVTVWPTKIMMTKYRFNTSVVKHSRRLCCNHQMVKMQTRELRAF